MEVKDELDIFERACLAYARIAREMRPGECDRHAMVGAFLTIREALRPRIDAVLYEEGGEWKSLSKQHMRGPIHAFKCADGRIWDVWNGWRS